MEYLRSITLITQKALIAGVLFACAALVSVSAPVARAEPQMTPVPGTTSLTQQLTGETAPQATPDPNAAPTVAQTLATPTTDSSQTDTTVAQSTNPSGTTNTGNKNDPLGCSLSNITLCLTGLVNWVAVEIPSFFLYIAAMFFSAAVHISLTGATYAIDFVATAWTIARDFANMLFLFILIYIAFQIMLDLDTGATLQTLASVIAIALIVNFSFFGTRLVIDMGNVLSVQIYNAIPADEGAATGSLLSQIGGKDLSSYVMKAINVQGLLSDQNFNNWYTKSNSSLSAFITITVLYICIGAIVITLAVSFFIAGTMFLGRIVFLWTAIALSPLALVMWTLGQTRNLFRSWWNMLFKNAFAPAVFLFMYLILTIFLKTIGAGNGGVVGTVFKSMTPASANLLSQDFLFQLGSNVASIILTLGIVVIFIQQATKATDGLGVASSKWAGNLGAKLNKNIVDRYTNMATKP
ncbi:MAG TPA: hypothetical protein VF803_02820, partial [Candidatus Paceibacterota bacterium]